MAVKTVAKQAKERSVPEQVVKELKKIYDSNLVRIGLSNNGTLQVWVDSKLCIEINKSEFEDLDCEHAVLACQDVVSKEWLNVILEK